MMTSTTSAIKHPILTKLAVCAVWAILWQAAHLLVYAAYGTNLLLPSPLSVLERLLQLLGTGSFYATVLHSFLRIFGGFLLGVLAGCLLGTVTAFCPLAHQFFAPAMSIIKATPVASFVILALVWIRGQNLSIFIAFLMVLPVIWSNVHAGFSSADPQLLEMAAVYRLPFHRRLQAIYLPAVFPYLLSAVRVGLGFSWKSGIAGEVIAIPSQAVGTELYNAKIYLDMPGLFAWTLVIVLLSVLLEQGVLRLLPMPGPREGEHHA